MKIRRAVFVLVVLLVGAVLWLARGFWVPLLPGGVDFLRDNADLVQAIEALLGIVAVLWAVGVSVYWFLGQRREDEGERFGSAPLRRRTVAELKRPFGLSGEVSWIDRGATSVQQLVAARRLVIVGRTKLGKSREAVELIRRAIERDVVTAERVFVPGNSLPFLNVASLQDVLRDTVDRQAALLLFVDDLPFHFGDEARLGQLTTALGSLRGVKAVYVVATARSDQLTEVHEKWLDGEGFKRVGLRDMDGGETGRLVDNGAGVFGLQLDEGARAALVEQGDGTPELTLLPLRRLQAERRGQVDEATARAVMAASLGEAWAAAEADICAQRPEANYLFAALGEFRAAGVDPYRHFVVGYAVVLWQKGQPGWRPRGWERWRRLERVLGVLRHFDVVVQEGLFVYPDVVANGR